MKNANPFHVIYNELIIVNKVFMCELNEMDKGLERKHSVPFVHEGSYEYQSGIL